MRGMRTTRRRGRYALAVVLSAALAAATACANDGGKKSGTEKITLTVDDFGTFGYQTTTRGNPVYLQYVPRTLAYARETLAAHPRFAQLREVLAGLLPELA